MAFVDPTQPGEEENQNQNPSQVDQALNPNQSQQSTQTNQADQAPPSTSAGGAGVAAAGSGAAGGSSSSPAPSKPSQSGSWTNLDSYLNANFDQASAMGQQIAQGVNAKGTQAQGEISDLGSNFGQAVQQNTVQSDSNAINQVLGDATSLTAGQQLSNADQAAFNNQANANYSGPQDVTAFNGYVQAQRDANEAAQNAQRTKTEAGRGSLLNDQYQNASQYGYTQGENNLDQLLLENSQGAQAALQPLAQKWSGLNGALNNTIIQGQQQVAQAQAADQATSAAAKNAAGQAEQNFEANINQGLANLQATDLGAYNNVMAAIKAGNLTPDTLNALGINPITHVYGGVDPNGNPTGVQLGSYLQQNAAPTLATFATADQYAQAQALAQLMGQNSSSFLNPASVGQAGIAETTPAYTFNNQQFTSDNNVNQQQYNSAQQQLLNQINAGYSHVLDGTTYHIGGPTPAQSTQDAANLLHGYENNYANQTGVFGGVSNWATNELKQLNDLLKEYGYQTE